MPHSREETPMQTHTNRRNISYAPTDTADLYPDTDGKPI